MKVGLLAREIFTLICLVCGLAAKEMAEASKAPSQIVRYG